MVCHKHLQFLKALLNSTHKLRPLSFDSLQLTDENYNTLHVWLYSDLTGLKLCDRGAQKSHAKQMGLPLQQLRESYRTQLDSAQSREGTTATAFYQRSPNNA
jgi:hypothetical protein